MPERLSEPLPIGLPSPPQAPERYEPIHPGSGRRPLRKRLARALAPLGVLLVKAKSLLLLLPKLKLLMTSGSMLVSIAAYGLLFGFPFAVGLVVLLFLHEIGHVIQLRREGIKASAPLFIPFLGAIIAAKSMGKDAAAEARVGLAGPVLGTIGVGTVGQPTSQIAPSRTSTGNVFRDRAPVVALTAPASGLNAPWGPRTISPVPTS